jgi:DNA-binding NarL/FixJ family response regulator
LTPREIEILELIDRGLTNQQIASRLSLTLHTVKNHVHNLLGKLGVASRAEAVAVFRATKYANPGG